MMSRVVYRLEQGLRTWEDLCLMHRAIANGLHRVEADHIPLAGPIVHSHEFRTHLLNDRGREASDERFVGAKEHWRALQTSLGGYFQLPVALTAWTRFSRRVFHLTSELQVLLNAVSIDTLSWGEILWPFNSFAVTLERPIRNPTGTEYDCVVFYRVALADGEKDTGKTALFFLLLPRKLADQKLLSGFDRDMLRTAIRRHDPRKVRSVMARVNGEKRLFDLDAACFSLDTSDAQTVVTTPVTEMRFGAWDGYPRQADGRMTHWDEAARIVVGLSVYLTTLPSSSPHRSRWVPLPKSGRLDPRAIVNEAEVCTVSSVFTLTSEEREVFGRTGAAGHELSTHFRRGHWRRRAGEGDDPSAPKVIMVRPTLVRGDRLPPGSVPGGTGTVVKP